MPLPRQKSANLLVGAVLVASAAGLAVAFLALEVVALPPAGKAAVAFAAAVDALLGAFFIVRGTTMP